MVLVALSNADANNLTRVSNYRQNKKSKSPDTLPRSTSERVFDNELPNGAKTVTAIRQQQKHHFTESETEQLIIDYTENRLTVYQLADKYKCGRDTISKVLKRNDVTVTRSRMDNTMTEQATRLYASGLSLKGVGEHMGICESTIRKTLIKGGVVMRQPRKYTGKVERNI